MGPAKTRPTSGHLSNDDPSSGYEGAAGVLQWAPGQHAGGRGRRGRRRGPPKHAALSALRHTAGCCGSSYARSHATRNGPKEYALGGWLEHPEALRRLEYRLRDARGKRGGPVQAGGVEAASIEPGRPVPAPASAGGVRVRAGWVSAVAGGASAGAWSGIVRPSLSRRGVVPDPVSRQVLPRAVRVRVRKEITVASLGVEAPDRPRREERAYGE